MRVTDQMQRSVEVPKHPVRIVSLVPSQTQLLYDLGLDDRVVGITKFCIHPDEWFTSKTRVGGTKAIDIFKVSSLKPDLIIGNKEENTAADIEALETVAPVWMSDIYTMEDAKDMIHQISSMTDTSEEGEELLKDISKGFEALLSSEERKIFVGKTALYYIWRNPNMVSGKNTFVDEMLSMCGFQNATETERYPEIDFLDDDPDYIFLSSEPFPFKEEHLIDFKTMFPKSKIVLVDGEMFSWYGSKLKEAPHYFWRLLKKLTSY